MLKSAKHLLKVGKQTLYDCVPTKAYDLKYVSNGVATKKNNPHLTNAAMLPV